ncbi:glycosyltransferase [Propylenella binzhouense]|uniref:glycosyltransferase n=1 Tax=Propylenella binzhouense TaxID=2555902 RepID=UPI001370EE25
MSGKHLLLVVTDERYFWGHRLALARAARDAGWAVTVATAPAGLTESIRAEGFRIEPIAWKRASLDPRALLAEVLALRRIFRRAGPDVVHAVSMRAVLAASLAALATPDLPMVNAFTGLGYTFAAAESRRARLLARLLAAIFRLTLRRERSVVLLENEDDRNFVVRAFAVPPERTAVNPGSGVDMARFAALPPPHNPRPVVACAARMLAMKGIPELVEARRILLARGVEHDLVLAGGIDPSNPTAISERRLRDWMKNDGVEWLGDLDDVRVLWKRADIAVLASRGGEGVPLSLVEAAASGRPLVATLVPGCRDIVEDGRNGLLVPPREPAALAAALERLIRDGELRISMGAASACRARAAFSSEIVTERTLALYRALTEGPPAGGRPDRRRTRPSG